MRQNLSHIPYKYYNRYVCFRKYAILLSLTTILLSFAGGIDKQEIIRYTVS